MKPPRYTTVFRPYNLKSLLAVVRKSGLVDEGKLLAQLSATPLPDDPDKALAVLVEAGLLTSFHAYHLREGRMFGFLIGPYRVLEPLGQGRMGLVYLAQQRSMSRLVALKVLRTELLPHAGARERFAREGRAIAALNHPNIMRLYDVQQDGDVHFMVMEYIDGKSLARLIKEEGRLPVARELDLIRQAAAGLQHAHARGVIYGDLKPANIFENRAGTVKLLGMGQTGPDEGGSEDVTERIGSPDFAAPEQVVERADAQSDVYALGAILYYLLIGEPPFAGATEPVTPPHVRDPSIPLEVSAVVLNMLARSPADRYQTAAEVLVALSVPRAGSLAEEPVEQAKPPRRGWW